jgi:dipeptidyl aminopeptidase/acylaminoacyl peptidase
VTRPDPLLLATLASLLLCACRGGTEAAALYVAHPDDASKQVEYFLEEPAGKNPPWPTVVLLHGRQQWLKPGGEVFIERGVLGQFAKRGYLAVAISQPGYGNSEGAPDFGGAFTQHAVAGVIAKLRAEGRASAQRLVIEGFSLGAVTAGLVAAQDPSISGLVLVSGVYDLPAYVADSAASAERRGIVRLLKYETGGTADALNARSVLRVANRIKASTLILNGAKDERTDAAQARRLAEDIVRSGGDAHAIIYPDVGHQIPVEVRNRDIDPFIDQVLGR